MTDKDKLIIEVYHLSKQYGKKIQDLQELKKKIQELNERIERTEQGG